MEDKYIDIIKTLEKHGESIEHLQKWEDKQNGRLDEIENKLDYLKTLLIGTLFTALSS